MCEYCEGDIWDRKTLESDNRIEYTIGDKKLLIASWTPAFDGYDAECNWESEIQINYCPMCREETRKCVNIVIKEKIIGSMERQFFNMNLRKQQDMKKLKKEMIF